MKAKEIRNIAEKIAQQEMIIQSNLPPEVRRQAEEEIIRITGRVKNFEDMILIDEKVQEILEKIS